MQCVHKVNIRKKNKNMPCLQCTLCFFDLGDGWRATWSSKETKPEQIYVRICRGPSPVEALLWIYSTSPWSSHLKCRRTHTRAQTWSLNWFYIYLQPHHSPRFPETSSRSAGFIQFECCFHPLGMHHHLILIQQFSIDLEGEQTHFKCTNLHFWSIFRFKPLHMQEYVSNYTSALVIS